MSHTGSWIIILGGVATLALGAFMFSLRPRRAASVWFGLYAIGIGGFGALNDGSGMAHFPPTGTWTRAALLAPFLLLTVIAVIGVALVFPRRLKSEDRADAAIAAAVALGLVAPLIARVILSDASGPALVLEPLWNSAGPARMGLFVLLLLRFRRSQDAQFRRDAALVAGAIVLDVAFRAGYGTSSSGGWSPLHADGWVAAYAFANLAVVIAAASAWLAWARGSDARTGRTLAWLSLGTTLVGLVLAAIGPVPASLGASRMLMTAAFAYAIVRHQILGIDVKVRWAISKSTIAAIFVAAFFVASEAAQQFFGETLQSTYLGIAAAGALVFAMAPLQRAAERLAEKAVPIAGNVAVSSVGAEPSAVEVAYKAAVRAAMKDGAISRREERHLAEIVRALAIDPVHAHDWRDEVQRETSSAQAEVAE